MHTPREQLAAMLRRSAASTCTRAWGPGRCLAELFEATCEASLWNPIFVTDFPVEVSPLARRHQSDPELTERFESYAVGRELSNGFSELIDPLDQRARFEEQARLAAAGEDETMPIDEDYIKALEWGLPPTAGLGVGMDRLAMLIADEANIREVIAFPTLKPLTRLVASGRSSSSDSISDPKPSTQLRARHDVQRDVRLCEEGLGGERSCARCRRWRRRACGPVRGRRR